ncbi:hypothetical protein MTO96_035943 [Rhipicephalus appendiculatus]
MGSAHLSARPSARSSERGGGTRKKPDKTHEAPTTSCGARCCSRRTSDEHSCCPSFFPPILQPGGTTSCGDARSQGTLITAGGLRDGRPKRKYDAALYEGVAEPEHRCERRLRRHPPNTTPPPSQAPFSRSKRGSSECWLAVPLTGLEPRRAQTDRCASVSHRGNNTPRLRATVVCAAFTLIFLMSFA